MTTRINSQENPAPHQAGVPQVSLLRPGNTYTRFREGTAFREGTGFSPYSNRTEFDGALAPEGHTLLRVPSLRLPSVARVGSHNPPQNPAILNQALFTALNNLLLRALKRPSTLLLSLFLLSPCLHAQRPSPSAKDLAQRVDRHYNTLHSLQANFTQNYQGLGVDRTESGTLLLLKPGRMRWNYTAPAGKLFLLDGKFAWFYTPGDAQVQRIPAKDLDDLRSPLRFLLGHTQLEKELTGLQLAPAPNGQFALTGLPKGQQNRVRRLTLTVTPDGVITAIEIQEADGALTRFTFTAQQPNAPVPPSTYRFNPPPGVPVVNAMPPV